MDAGFSAWLAAAYIGGVVVAFAATDAPWAERAGVALLWPLGPLAFIMVATMLLVFAMALWWRVGVVVVGAVVAAWWMWG